MIHALFIDDDAGSLTTFDVICQQEGIAFTGIQAPTTLNAQLDQLDEIDIVLVDLSMPKMDGYAVLALLRAHPGYQHIPIVACTVNTSQIDDARAAGFDGFIQKPINADAFADQIQSIINGASIWQT